MAAENKGGVPGFTLMEFIIVLTIIAIMVMLAVPALMSIVPQAQMRGAGRSTANLLQQARLMADNSQKPARLSLDCRGAGPCLARLYAAVFLPNGTLDYWAEVPGTKRELGQTIRVASGGAPVPDNPAGLFWAVFFPKGQMRGSHEPWRLLFSSTRVRGSSWELAVSGASGRVTLRGLE